MNNNVIKLGSIEHFKPHVLEADVPVLVDFYADWCGPCRSVAPVLEQLAGEMEGRAKIVKVNVDDLPELSQRFKVQSIPTLLLFRDGALIDSMVGALPGHVLRAKLEAAAPSAATA